MRTAAQGNYGFLLDHPSTGFMLMLPNALAGQYNSLTQTGDQALIFGKTVGTGSLVIAPWANAASGLKILGNGDIGVGTANPSSPFHIESTLDGNWRFPLYINKTTASNSDTNIGIRVKGGDDTAIYFQAEQSNGDLAGLIFTSGGTFQLADLSDPDRKVDIRPTTVAGLDVVNAIDLIEFRFRSSSGTPSKLHAIGFNSENVAKIFPEATTNVDVSGENQTFLLRSELIPVALKAIQELYAQNRRLESENTYLLSELDDLKGLVCEDHPAAALCNR